MPYAPMHHDVPPDQVIRDQIGDISNIEVFNNHVLVAVYERPTDGKTKGGIVLPQTNTDEDKYQSKVGLIIKLGPRAFEKEEGWTWAEDLKEGDWIVFRPSDGWNIGVKGKSCRMLLDTNVRMRIPDPDMVW